VVAVAVAVAEMSQPILVATVVLAVDKVFVEAPAVAQERLTKVMQVVLLVPLPIVLVAVAELGLSEILA
jgi:hypothetical protein